MYNLFWSKVNDILENSIFGSVYLAVVNFISQAFKNSYFYSFFASKDMNNYAKSSIISSFFKKLIFESKFAEIVSQSWFVKIISFMPETVFSAPCYIISYYLLPSSVVLLIRYLNNKTYAIIYAVAILVAISIAFSKIKLGDVVNNSCFLKFFCKFFY